MHFLTFVLIGLALAMDAFAVSIASGVAVKKLQFKHALVIACWFGGFQAVMPVIGWLCGASVSSFIEGFDHWIAFLLLTVIGGKMIYEAFKIEEVEKIFNPMETKIIFMLAVATSIDALAVGFSFAILKDGIVMPAVIIGVVTFITSFIGVLIGDKLGYFFDNKIEIAAGLILIAIGIKILISHLIK